MNTIGKSLVVCASLLATSIGAHAQVNITTWQGNNQHHGTNLNETTLTPALVSSPGNFGLLFSQPMDGQCYSQPLYVSGLTGIAGGTHNVVYLETQHNTVYAFDADNNTGGNASPLWSKSFLGANEISVPQSEVGSGDIQVELGNTATPVIDLPGNTIYCLSKVKNTVSNTYIQKLHALDLKTGAEKFGGPVVINPTFPGSANDGTGGVIPFNPLRSHARAALTLYNGVVYVTYASHSDTQPYHGEIVGFNSTTLAWLPARTFIASPNNGLNGIWQGGASLALDSAGNMYVATGNGAWDQNTSPYTTGTNWGESFLKLPPTGTFNVAFSNTNNWFTPNNWNTLNFGDADLGSSGLLLLPDQTGPHSHLLVGGGKGGQLYVIDRDAMGGMSTPNNSVQEITEVNSLFVTPSYFNGNIYYAPAGGKFIQRAVGYNSVDGSYLAPTAVKSNFTYNGGHGAGTFITANGTTNGIAWILDLGNPAKLHAYNAANVSGDPIYSGTATLPGNINVKGPTFGLPVAANGKVYFAGYNTTTNTGYLTVWGQPPAVAGTPATPTNAAVTPVASSQLTITWTDNANNESGYKIKRSTSLTGTYTVLTPTPSTGADVTSFTDTGLAPYTTYYYQVVGTNANGDSTPSVVASGTTFPTYAVSGLVAYWNLDEISGGTSTDITGNAHTGTWEGEQAADVGYFNGGHWYHGTGAIASRISVANKTDIQFTAGQSFTLSAWVKPSALRSSPEAVIAKSRDTGNYYGIWINAANQWTAKGPGGDVVGPAVTQDVWTHVTVVQDGPGNTRKLYINGALSATGTAQAADGTGALWLGQANSGGNAVIEAFPGYIDEVRIYNRALPAAEVTDLLGAPVLQATSSQVQGTAGTFGLVLAPVTVQVIESRQGATAGSYSIVTSFSAPVYNVAAALTLQSGGAATGTVGTITYSNGNKIATIPLTGVANAQKLKLHLTGIKRNGSAADAPGTADILFNVLRGDVNKDNVVSSLDATIVNNSQAAAVVANSFFYDINCDGAVNAADTALVNSYIGTNIGTQLDSNIALFCPAVASTTNGASVAGNAFDGKGVNQTRWESASADPQWIYVNLGSVSTIHQINVNWEAAAGKTYTFEVSNDASTWSSPIATETNNTGAGIKSYPVSATGQYVRLSGTTRTTQYGYSPWEIEVIGVPGSGGGGNPPVITSALTKAGSVGAALTYNITANNTPTSYGATALAGTGLSINTTTGVISGTPTAAGTINSTITATNAFGTDTETLVITISAGGAAPVISSALTASASVGTAFSYTITATNTPTSFGATALTGTGLSVNTTTGVISGTPTATGTISSTITATNASGSDSKTLVITVTAAGDLNLALNKTVTVTSTENVGTPGSSAVDGNLGTRWSSAPQIDPQTISVDLGQPCTVHSVVLTWENAGGKDYTVDASDDGVNWTTNIATVTGNTVTGTASPLTYNAPGGAVTARFIRVNGTARILTPYGYSLWELAVMGTTGGGGGSAPVINSALTKSGTVGTALSYTITATNTPTSFGATALTGTGLSINTTTGVISGTPTAAGTINSTITATNATGSDSKTLVITIAAAGSPPVINSALTAGATAGTAFSYTITATNTPTSFNATALAGTGLSVNTTTGVISGTPTAAGTITSTITATNASGSDNKTLVITVGAAGDTNLALGDPATASSFEPGNLVANGNDASTTNRWAAVNATYPQWWRVDLGASKVLSRVDIMWYAPTTRAYKYKIETSPDDVTYTTAFDNTANTTFGNTSNTITATARYVRVTVTGSSNGGFASFYDLKVFGH